MSKNENLLDLNASEVDELIQTLKEVEDLALSPEGIGQINVVIDLFENNLDGLYKKAMVEQVKIRKQSYVEVIEELKDRRIRLERYRKFLQSGANVKVVQNKSYINVHPIEDIKNARDLELAIRTLIPRIQDDYDVIREADNEIYELEGIIASKLRQDPPTDVSYERELISILNFNKELFNALDSSIPTSLTRTSKILEEFDQVNNLFRTNLENYQTMWDGTTENKIEKMIISTSRSFLSDNNEYSRESDVRLQGAFENGLTFKSELEIFRDIDKIARSIWLSYKFSGGIPWAAAWELVVLEEIHSPSGYGDLSTIEYIQLVAFENEYPPEVLEAIIFKEQFTKLPPDWSINLAERLGVLRTGHSMGIGAIFPTTSINSLYYYDKDLLQKYLYAMGIDKTADEFYIACNSSKLTWEELNIYEDYLQKHNDFSIDSINATLHYYNDNGSKGVELKDENDLSMITIIRDESEEDDDKVVGIADGSIEPIDISNWENLTYDEKVEAIGRYNADDSDAKKKYGSIVVDAIGKVE